jgi:hydrogenase expression/formation protein HypC
MIIMCLGIPMQIIEIDGFDALCEAKGVRREVSLYLVQGEQVAIGDFIMVHVGYAIQKMSKSEAQSAWELHDELLSSRSSRA